MPVINFSREGLARTLRSYGETVLAEQVPHLTAQQIERIGSRAGEIAVSGGNALLVSCV